MPDTRWWKFEDRETHFGNIQPNSTDLGKLLLMEFGLVYANDWFVFPYELKAGSIAKVKGLAITNVFGERIWIEAAGKGNENNWQRWAMFNVSQTPGNAASDESLVMLPTVPKIQEGPLLEDIALIRDEIANMVWGIEHKVPLAHGQGKPGGEAAQELHTHYQRLLDDELEQETLQPLVRDYQAGLRYEVVNRIPDQWIPFIPVHVPGNVRNIQLQRAALPRILDNDPRNPEKIRPRSQLLREGLEQSSLQTYFIYEEEVPRSGIRLSQAFQRTRWYNGKVVNWLGVRKQVGRGEGNSGLAFDQMISRPKKLA